ncbi:MAG: tol-pal system protein YbgF [Candidatus Eisenbacteria bacterium]|nr:tol-pal system protein YbgF [Candidatus Latescibacterota bacterium]MBD3301997.1 tol-pal system protein YbgF [Candidatus Eisenbacteria bacterium]
MRRSRSVWVWVLVFPVLSGCYGAKMIRQPIAIDNTEQRVASLTEQQAKLTEEIRELRGILARQEEMIRALRADSQTRLLELTRSIDAVGIRIDDTFERPDVHYPVQQGPEDPYAPPSSFGAADTLAPEEELSPIERKAIYDNAYLDLNRGNYRLALLGFREYLQKSPDSDLSDNAQYWIGECSYAQQEYRTAIEEFREVERRFPRGDKVPAALLKIAYSYLQLGDREAARDTLRDLMNRYPTTEEAEQARQKIRTLD